MLTDMMNNAIGQYLVTVLTCNCAQKLSRKKRVPIVSVSHMGPRTPALHTASTSNVLHARRYGMSHTHVSVVVSRIAQNRLSSTQTDRYK